MRRGTRRTVARIVLAIGVLSSAPVAAQAPAARPLTEAECQALRGQLAEHARLSDGVRRAVAARAAATPAPVAPAVGSAPAAGAAGRAAEIRARLERIGVERQQAEVEVVQGRETRTTAGALVGTRASGAPIRFAIERRAGRPRQMMGVVGAPTRDGGHGSATAESGEGDIV